jgi:hypothetical protein
MSRPARRKAGIGAAAARGRQRARGPEGACGVCGPGLQGRTREAWYTSGSRGCLTPAPIYGAACLDDARHLRGQGAGRGASLARGKNFNHEGHVEPTVRRRTKEEKRRQAQAHTRTGRGVSAQGIGEVCGAWYASGSRGCLTPAPIYGAACLGNASPRLRRGCAQILKFWNDFPCKTISD